MRYLNRFRKEVQSQENSRKFFFTHYLTLIGSVLSFAGDTGNRFVTSAVKGKALSTTNVPVQSVYPAGNKGGAGIPWVTAWQAVVKYLNFAQINGNLLLGEKGSEAKR